MDSGSSEEKGDAPVTAAAKMRIGDIVLDDPEIGLAAKGVFVTIGLLGSSCTLEELGSHCSDAPDAIRAAVGELVDHRYVTTEDDRIVLRDLSSLGIPD